MQTRASTVLELRSETAEVRGNVGDGVGTRATHIAGTGHVRKVGAMDAFRTGAVAAQRTHFIDVGVLVTQTHGTKTTTEAQIGLAVEAGRAAASKARSSVTINLET